MGAVIGYGIGWSWDVVIGYGVVMVALVEGVKAEQVGSGLG